MSQLLPGAIWTLTVLAWLSAAVLVRAARGAQIGALTERAIVAVGLAVFGTAYSLAVYNTEIARLLPDDVVMLCLRLFVIAVLLLPCYWTLLYLSGRLGDNGDGGP